MPYMSDSDAFIRARLIRWLPIGQMPRLTIDVPLKIGGVGDERHTHDVSVVGLFLPEAPSLRGLGSRVEH